MKEERTGTWVRQVAQAMEERLREDKQELKMRKQKRKAEDAKRIREIVHDNNKNNRLSWVQNEMENLMHHDEQELLNVWEGWHWDDNKGGWLDPELCARARRGVVEYIRRHKMHTQVSKQTCLRETGRAPIKTGWAETDKDNPGSPTCARGGSRRNTRLTRGQSRTRQRRRSRRGRLCFRRSLQANVEEK